MTTSRMSAISLSLLSLAIVACDWSEPSDSESSSSSSSASSTATVDRTDREAVADAILDAFAAGDWEEVSTYVSDDGVRFTPHTYINVTSDQTFSVAEIATFASDNTVKTWGTQEGSGFPIDMTNAQYVGRYVWDHDYRDADSTRWDMIQDYGSVIDNAQDVYPGAAVVEYHFNGFDPQYGGMDWRSLRLVLDQDDDGNYALVGVIHDEWAP